VQLGLGVRMAAISMDVAQGSLRQTGGDLDLAIEGRGYFEIELPSGNSGYTRDGSLKRSGEGLVVTSEGYAVVPQITIPSDARQITVNASGDVFAFFDNTPQGQLLGRITLASFTNDKGLEALGGNLFLETEASGPPLTGDPDTDGRGAVRQGYLEQSSVDAVSEITELIEAQRGYELNSKVITATDQMLAATAQIR